MWCDSAEPASIKEFRKGGYLAQPVVKEPNSVKAQIDWLKDRRIFIDGSCVHLLKEIQQYRWQVDRVTGEFLDIPITVNDDCIAALRYGIEPWRKARGLRTMDKGAFGL
jgi:phage terminase large subunit